MSERFEDVYPPIPPPEYNEAARAGWYEGFAMAQQVHSVGGWCCNEEKPA